MLFYKNSLLKFYIVISFLQDTNILRVTWNKSHICTTMDLEEKYSNIYCDCPYLQLLIQIQMQVANSDIYDTTSAKFL